MKERRSLVTNLIAIPEEGDGEASAAGFGSPKLSANSLAHLSRSDRSLSSKASEEHDADTDTVSETSEIEDPGLVVIEPGIRAQDLFRLYQELIVKYNRTRSKYRRKLSSLKRDNERFREENAELKSSSVSMKEDIVKLREREAALKIEVAKAAEGRGAGSLERVSSTGSPTPRSGVVQKTTTPLPYAQNKIDELEKENQRLKSELEESKWLLNELMRNMSPPRVTPTRDEVLLRQLNSPKSEDPPVSPPASVPILAPTKSGEAPFVPFMCCKCRALICSARSSPGQDLNTLLCAQFPKLNVDATFTDIGAGEDSQGMFAWLVSCSKCNNPFGQALGRPDGPVGSWEFDLSTDKISPHGMPITPSSPNTPSPRPSSPIIITASPRSPPSTTTTPGTSSPNSRDSPRTSRSAGSSAPAVITNVTATTTTTTPAMVGQRVVAQRAIAGGQTAPKPAAPAPAANRVTFGIDSLVPHRVSASS